MLTDYIESLRHERRLSERTISAYVSDIRRTATAAGVTCDTLATLDARTLSHAMAKLGRSGTAAASQNRTRAALVSFFGFAVHSRVRTDNPAKDLPKANGARRIPHCAKADDLTKLVAAAAAQTDFYRARDLAIVILLAGSGLRRSELTALVRDDIDMENRTVRVRCGKGRKERLVPLWTEGVSSLAAFLAGHTDGPLWQSRRGGAMTASGVWRVVARLAKHAGLDGVTPHSLRRGFATAAHKAGANLLSISKMLGHSDPRTTSGYIYPDMDTLRVKNLYPDLSPRGTSYEETQTPAL
jgi:site-specific recombinase XerD